VKPPNKVTSSETTERNWAVIGKGCRRVSPPATLKKRWCARGELKEKAFVSEQRGKKKTGGDSRESNEEVDTEKEVLVAGMWGMQYLISGKDAFPNTPLQGPLNRGEKDRVRIGG